MLGTNEKAQYLPMGKYCAFIFNFDSFE